jgi:hypothetical protein
MAQPHAAEGLGATMAMTRQHIKGFRWRSMTTRERIMLLMARQRMRRAMGEGIDHGYLIRKGIELAAEMRLARNAEKFDEDDPCQE